MTKAAPDASKAIPPARKILWLGIAVAVAALAWTAGWFYVAGRMEAGLPQAIAAARQNGIEPHCDNPDIRGFPFRFGLFCDSSGFDFQAGRLMASAGAFRSAAQFYRPGHVVSELEGPLTISGSDGLSARLDWQLLHASSVVVPSGLSRASVEGKMLTIDLDASNLPAKFAASAETVAVHARRDEENLDIAASAQSLSSPAFPAFRTATLEATVPGGAVWLRDGRLPENFRGTDVILHRLGVEFAMGGGLSVSGRGSIGEDGLVSGDFHLRIKDHEAAIAALAELAPDIAAQASSVGTLLIALDTEPGDDAVTLPLDVRDGRVAIGMIPLGSIPRL